MDAKVTWKQGMSFDGTGAGGWRVPLGTSPAVGGADDGFRPLEMLLIGLAGCTAMDVASILAKKRQTLSAFEVRVHAQNASEHPKVFTRVELEYRVAGVDLDPAAVERAVQLSVEKYCPAHAMLRQSVPISVKITLLPDPAAVAGA